MLTTDEKREAIRKAVVEQANEVLRHPTVKDVQKEYADNMGFDYSKLPWYGIGKIAHYSAQIATAVAWGVSPDIILLYTHPTDEQINKAYERLADLNIVPTEV